MIQHITSCPYCGGEVAIDIEVCTLLFIPETCPSEPCRHLACLWVTLEREPHAQLPDGETWLVCHGQPSRKTRNTLRASDLDLVKVILTLAHKDLPLERATSLEHQTVGGSAAERDAEHPGSGTFLVRGEGGKERMARLDGWAVYSPTPALVLSLMWAMSMPSRR